MPTILSKTFNALNKEAQFTREMLGTGATQIRKANYASKGIYFQAFTSLSTGLERIGKLCLIVDYSLEHEGKFPDPDYLKHEICHDIAAIYEKSMAIVRKRSITMMFLRDLGGPIHHAILSVLSEFAKGDRYSNINLLVGGKRQKDPISAWFQQVDQPLWNQHVSQNKKDTVRRNVATVDRLMGEYRMVLHTSELGEEISDIEEASHRTGMWHAVAPFRQLYVLQIIRYWAELLSSLQYGANSENIPYFSEIFALFYNNDSYFKTRKTWDAVR